MRISDWSSDVCSSDLWISTALATMSLTVNGLGGKFGGTSSASVAYSGGSSVTPAPSRYVMYAFMPATKLCVTSRNRSEEHTSELQSLMRISYAVFCLKKNIT